MPIRAQPSELASQTEDQIGVALANVRRQIRGAVGDELARLQQLRDDLNARLDDFVALDLQQIDADPEIAASIDQLAQLTLDVQKTVREMQDVTRTIAGAAQVLGFVDELLGVVAKVR
jgi:hypothetical protein